MDVASRIRDIVVEYIGCDPKAVVPDASFIDDLGADSLDSVELVLAFEEAFGIEITSHEEEDIHTVGDVINRVQAKTGLA